MNVPSHLLQMNNEKHKPLFHIGSKHFKVYCVVFIVLSVLSTTVSAKNLEDFSARFNVQVAGFNLGQGTHKMTCIEGKCTLKSAARPSGFIRNFFKDELYETSQFIQNKQSIQWLSYRKREVKFKRGEQRETNMTLKVVEDNILLLETDKQFPKQDFVYDPMSIAYVMQWLRLNNQPRILFDGLILQTEKQQLPIHFTEFAQPISKGFDFAEQTLTGEKYRFQSDKIDVELWLVKRFNWFPAKINITRKDKNRTITLNLASPPKFLSKRLPKPEKR